MLIYLFQNTSGLNVNLRKSMATWLGGIEDQQLLIASLFNWKVGSFFVTYLGIPHRLGSLLKKDWQCMIDKIEKRMIHGEVILYLELVLTTFVLSSLASYLASFSICLIGLSRG